MENGNTENTPEENTHTLNGKPASPTFRFTDWVLI